MELTDLKPGVIIRGPVIPEPIQVVAVIPMGVPTQILGKGLETGQFHDPILSKEQIALLTAPPEKAPFAGDAKRFRLSAPLGVVNWSATGGEMNEAGVFRAGDEEGEYTISAGSGITKATWFHSHHRISG